MGFEEVLSADEGGSKKGKPEYEKVFMSETDSDGLNVFDKYVAARSLVNKLESEVKVMDEEIKSVLRHKFVEAGLKNGIRTDSVEAQGKISSGVATLKVASTTAIDKPTQDLFKKAGISFEQKKTVQFKKEVIEDDDKVAKVIAAFKSAGLDPKDYLDMSSKVVPCEKTINDILDNVIDPAVAESYIKKSTTVAIRILSDFDKARGVLMDILEKAKILTT